MIRNLLLAGAAALATLAHVPAARADAAKPIEPGPWAFKTVVGLNLSQSAYSTNWRGGDNGSIVWVLNSSSSAERQFTKRFHLLTTLGLAYGQTVRQVLDPANPSERVWDDPDKTTDQILLESTGRFTLGGFVDPYLALRGESQFLDQSYAPLGVGDLALNPIRLKESAGVARVLVKTDDRELTTRIGAAFRQVLGNSFVLDPATSGYVKDGFTTNDGGLEWQTSAVWPLFEKKVLYKGALLVYQPVFYSNSGALERFDDEARAADPAHENAADFWKTTDLDLQNTFTAQITKGIGVQLFVQWVYDQFDAAANVKDGAPLATNAAEVAKATRKAGQFKQTFALALTYQLF